MGTTATTKYFVYPISRGDIMEESSTGKSNEPDLLSSWRKEPAFGAVLALLLGPSGLIYVDAGIGCLATIAYILVALLLSPVSYGYYFRSHSGGGMFFLSVVLHIICAVVCYSLCKSKNKELDDAERKIEGRSRIKTLMTITKAEINLSSCITAREELFGKLPDGNAVQLFTLSNALGITIGITNYGGRVVSIRTPDRNGVSDWIAVGFDSLEKYLQANGYHGAILGRVANRIRAGEFALNGTKYRLHTNADGSHINGGQAGFSHRLWDAAIENNRLRLDYFSPDGEEGYPGNVKATVWYSLEGTDLRIDYEATTDRTTIVNLSSHLYFNLSSFQELVLGHEFRVQAERYLPLDARFLPTGESAPVQNTRFDFTKVAGLSGKVWIDSKEFIDHYLIFNRQRPPIEEWLAEVSCPTTGRTLAMTTTEPGIQFCAGKDINIAVPGLGGRTYSSYSAFSLKAQRYPDAINHPDFPSIILEPGESYRQTTIYRFGIDWAYSFKQPKIDLPRSVVDSQRFNNYY